MSDQRSAIPMGHGVHFCPGASLAKLEGRIERVPLEHAGHGHVHGRVRPAAAVS